SLAPGEYVGAGMQKSTAPTCLEHDPEKCAGFRKRSCSNINLERDDDSGKVIALFRLAVQAAFSSPSGLGARMVIEPPAFSTAARAVSAAPATAKATLALTPPPPRSRTPPLARRSTPALTSASASTVAAGSSLPASIACWMRPRLTSLSRL